MPPALGRFRPIAITLAVLLVLMIGWLMINIAARSMVGTRIERWAQSRGFSASWRSLNVRFPDELSVEGLALSPSAGPPVLHADTLEITVSMRSLLAFQPTPKRIMLAHGGVVLGAAAGVDPDTLAPAENADNSNGETAPDAPLIRMQERVRSVINGLLMSAREMKRVSLRDVRVAIGASAADPTGGLLVEHFLHERHGSDVTIEANGTAGRERAVMWNVDVDYLRDDRLAGTAAVDFPAQDGQPAEHLDLSIAGRFVQDAIAGRVVLGDSTVIMVGELPFLVSAQLSRVEPRIACTLAIAGVTGERLENSLPSAVLGPLNDLQVRGAFDYRARFDLDLSHPEDVEIEARVIPRGLAIDTVHTRLDLDLDRPFVAHILLPRGEVAERDLSPLNPFFRPLDEIDPVLVHAVVTNEDGGFFEHGGFNLRAVKSSIAENLRAGRYRRGAGTITMQLARNLYTGHQRTLARKGQEVVLAWVIEHLTGVSKQRLLEIYLNIIEWGPGVHGAAEAARYYFDRDVSDLTVDEALFLCTVVPAPSKWRYRVDDHLDLRPFARAQMHYIGRAMIRKGWLDPERLPPADSLRIELRGAARAALAPADSTLEQAMRNLEGERLSPWQEPVESQPLETPGDTVSGEVH